MKLKEAQKIVAKHYSDPELMDSNNTVWLARIVRILPGNLDPIRSDDNGWDVEYQGVEVVA